MALQISRILNTFVLRTEICRVVQIFAYNTKVYTICEI